MYAVGSGVGPAPGEAGQEVVDDGCRGPGGAGDDEFDGGAFGGEGECFTAQSGGVDDAGKVFAVAGGGDGLVADFAVAGVLEGVSDGGQHLWAGGWDVFAEADHFEAVVAVEYGYGRDVGGGAALFGFGSA